MAFCPVLLGVGILRAERKARSEFRATGDRARDKRDSDGRERRHREWEPTPVASQPPQPRSWPLTRSAPSLVGGLQPAARGQASLHGLTPRPQPLDSSGLCTRPHRPRCPGCLGLVGSGGLLASAPPPAPGTSRQPGLSLPGSPSASTIPPCPPPPCPPSLPLLCLSVSLHLQVRLSSPLPS